MNCKNYLETIINLDCNNSDFSDFLLSSGNLFIESKKFKPTFNPEIKMCFQNSVKGSLINGLDYYEGLYLTEIGFPVAHAFNVENGIVIDLTADKFKINVSEWFGIYIPHQILLDYINSENFFLTPLMYYWRQLTDKKNK